MNSNTKTIALTLLATSIVAAWATLASSSSWTINNQINKLQSTEISDFGFWHWKKWMMMWKMWDFSHGFGFMNNELTTEEKTKLESMTNDEKKSFFEAKRVELEASIEARETVIDKLLNWETLTIEDKKIVEEIKTQRAEMKTKRQEMEEIRNLMEKQRSWETLTTDEQTKLDEFKSNMPQRWWKWFWRFN